MFIVSFIVLVVVIAGVVAFAFGGIVIDFCAAAGAFIIFPVLQGVWQLRWSPLQIIGAMVLVTCLCAVLDGVAVEVAVAIGLVSVDFGAIRIKLCLVSLSGTWRSLSSAVTCCSAVTTVAWNAVNTVSTVSEVDLVVAVVTVSLESTQVLVVTGVGACTVVVLLFSSEYILHGALFIGSIFIFLSLGDQLHLVYRMSGGWARFLVIWVAAISCWNACLFRAHCAIVVTTLVNFFR